MATYTHPTAHATGVLDSRYDAIHPLVHYRGIKYASIAERFASPELLPWAGTKAAPLNAQSYG
jgi:hypothetical protein